MFKIGGLNRVFIAVVIARLSSLISFPVVARVLDPAELGNLTMWHTVRGFLLLLCLVGQPELVARNVATSGNITYYRHAFRLSVITFTLVMSIYLIVLMYPSQLINVPYPYLIPVAVLFDLVPGLYIGILPAIGRVGIYCWALVIPALIASLSSAVLVSKPFSLGIFGCIASHGISTIVLILYCYSINRYIKLESHSKIQKCDLLRASLPILGVSFLGLGLTSIDKYTIDYIYGAVQLAFYAVAMQVAALISFGASAIRAGINSTIIKFGKNSLFISSILKTYIGIGMSASIFLTAISPDLVMLIAGKQYIGITHFIPFLMLSVLSLELFSFFQMLSVALNKPGLPFKGLLIAFLTGLIFIPLLSYAFGLIGTGLALALSYSCGVFYLYYVLDLKLDNCCKIFMIYVSTMCLAGLIYASDVEGYTFLSISRYVLSAIFAIYTIYLIRHLTKKLTSA